MRVLLVSILTHPTGIEKLTLAGWDLLLQQAYSTNTIGILAETVFALRQDWGIVPKEVLWHLLSAQTRAREHATAATKEANTIATVLTAWGFKPLFLKGVAYSLCADPGSEGRIFNDIDVFFPRNELPSVEQCLKWHGWKFDDELNAYDEAYFRNWMHELPPLIHAERGTVLDVHHSLVPLTSAYTFDSKKILETAEKINGLNALVLSKQDRVLHAAVHLFLDTEFDNAFRDLYLVYTMMKSFSTDEASFLSQLTQRAEELGFSDILYLTFTYVDWLFGFPELQVKLQKIAKGRLKHSNYLCHLAFRNVFVPTGAEGYAAFNRRIGRAILFMRGHLLKMPPQTLLKHALYKGLFKPVKSLKNVDAG